MVGLLQMTKWNGQKLITSITSKSTWLLALTNSKLITESGLQIGVQLISQVAWEMLLYLM